MVVSVKARRTFSKSQKLQILREHSDNGLSISLLSRKHQVSPITLYHWKRMFMTDQKPKTDELLPDDLFKELERLRRENDNLRKALASEAIEKEILRHALDIGIKKNIDKAKSKQRKK